MFIKYVFDVLFVIVILITHWDVHCQITIIDFFCTKTDCGCLEIRSETEK